jgi:transposase
MRKQYDSLAVLVVQALKRDLLTGDMFLFVGRNRKRAKVLFFDGTGLCLFSKRLERGLFANVWARADGRSVELTQSELTLFIEGNELVGRVALSPRVVTCDDRQVVFR